jgi:hypothetical protein
VANLLGSVIPTRSETAMNLVRPALALVVGLFLVVAGQAGAAGKPKPTAKPKTVCNLVTDSAGDANGLPLVGTVGAGPSDGAYDITSIDVASNLTTLTGVVRVVKLAKTTSGSPTGIHWTVALTIGTAHFLLSANQETTGTNGAELDSVDPATNTYTKITDARAVYDVAKNEVRISAAVRDFTETIKVGRTVLSGLGGSAGRVYGVKDVTGRFGNADLATGQDATDSATGSKTYTAGTPSCVAPGA